MPAPQGIMRFPGVDSCIQWCFTMSHGIGPGVATMRIRPQASLPYTPETMSITFGEIQLDFPGCIIDQASIRRDPGTGLIGSIAIKDRRWAWQYGDPISGRYNVRLKGASADDATSIDPNTLKTTQELARLLLDKMGEEDYDISQLPTGPNPEVNWEYTNPARA